MSKYEGEIRAAGEGSAKLQDLLGKPGQLLKSSHDRHDALAHFLSGDDGWHAAGKSLRGTFAKGARDATGLSKGSDK